MRDEIIFFEDIDYLLVSEPEPTNYMDRAVYEAKAIINNAAPDKSGTVQAYTLRWEIPHMTQRQIDNGETEFDNIDWECPDAAEEDGWYLYAEDTFVK